MTGEDVEYEVTEIKVIRGAEAKAIARKQKEGWELVTRDQGRLRTTLTFRKPKPQIPWRMLATIGGAGVILAAVVGVGALVFAPGGEPAQADPVVATVTTSAKPTPTTTTSAPPTSTLPPITTAIPEPEPVIAEEEAHVAPVPFMQPDAEESTFQAPSGPVLQSPPPPPPAREPQPEPVAPAPAPPVSTYYANCDEARAAGVAPIYRGEPGYALKLDRNKDGVACE